MQLWTPAKAKKYLEIDIVLLLRSKLAPKRLFKARTNHQHKPTEKKIVKGKCPTVRKIWKKRGKL